MTLRTFDDLTDPVEEMLKKTGCIEMHYKVIECFSETKDWRKCQDVVKDFRECMNIYNSKKHGEDATK
ncbi:hypothetical protein RI129_011019 [Pyrocoelia pectoralis]|uniref:Uncharacterized protein n=1 Tax=Pyrocoelia pectoralis TaxID=417401 RepID=A0AAN7ZIF4_9COLE